MRDWIDNLYAVSLDLNTSADVVHNIQQLPDLLEKHLTILPRYSYRMHEVIVYKFDASGVLGVQFLNSLIGRMVEISFAITDQYPGLGIRIIDLDSERRPFAYLSKYFIQKSNGKVRYDDFNLATYSGNIEERIKAFAEFLHGQFRIRGLFWLDGTHWMGGYGLGI